MRQTYKGKITISRPQVGGQITERVRITLRDEEARTQFLEVDIDLDEFALALTGLSERPCDFEPHRLDTVGKVREHENITFVLTGEYMERHKLNRYFKEEIRLHMMIDPEKIFRQTDGWELSVYLGGQTSITTNYPDGIRINTTRVRYVERKQP